MNPYIRAAQKIPALRQQAQERLGKRLGHAGRPIIPEAAEDRPQPPAAPGRRPEPAQDWVAAALVLPAYAVLADFIQL